MNKVANHGYTLYLPDNKLALATDGVSAIVFIDVKFRA